MKFFSIAQQIIPNYKSHRNNVSGSDPFIINQRYVIAISNRKKTIIITITITNSNSNNNIFIFSSNNSNSNYNKT